jgi:2,5-furandicarboxylate decarboxylase 1
MRGDMILRDHIQNLEHTGRLIRIRKEISKDLEIAGILNALEPKPVYFENVKESAYSVVGNLFCSKAAIASYLKIKADEIIPTLIKAIENRSPPEVTKSAPCQEVIENSVNLDSLPILRHNEVEPGPYISSGVVVTKDPEYGQNLDFHRAMQIGKDRMVTRIVRGHDFDKFLEKNDELDVAYCIGNTAEVLVAAATTVKIGIDELEIANALRPIHIVKADSVDLMVPADSEFILEGRVFLEELHDEGPFVDITETVEPIRQQPIFEVRKITHRKNAIWQGLLPGKLEHKLLMGMPREPTVFRKIREKGVDVQDVYVTPGGTCWLHIAVKINKKNEDDGIKAIEGAFEGHRSAKHVWIYNDDVDIYNEQEREWAMATRFQGDENMLIKDREPGSSLDPSAEPGTKMTTKIGFDLTKPLVVKGKSFEKAKFPEIDMERFQD